MIKTIVLKTVKELVFFEMPISEMKTKVLNLVN